MRPANGSRARSEEVLREEDYWACFAVPVLFWLFASLTITMGYYGTKTVVMGPNYSHLIEANSLFVSHIQVSEAHQKGPSVYGLSVQPVLSSRSSWTENHTVLLKPNYHQDFSVWLNKGSKLHVTCFIRSTGFYSVLLSVTEGYNGLKRWIQNPTNPHAAAEWIQVYGQVGGLEHEVKRDADYFIAVGNLNEHPVAIELQVEVNATMYSTESADSKCSLGGKSCKVELPVVGKRYALLNTPASENSTLSWHVKLSYGTRWMSYYTVLAGILLLVSAFLKLVSRVDQSLQEQEQRPPEDDGVGEDIESPLLSLKAGDTDDVSCEADLDGEDTVDLFNGTACNSQQLCVICLDAPKTVFFMPCGHFATCLACANRIRNGETGSCPICRVKIKKISRVFQV